jgi:hypothetical protein
MSLHSTEETALEPGFWVRSGRNIPIRMFMCYQIQTSIMKNSGISELARFTSFELAARHMLQGWFFAARPGAEQKLVNSD